MTGKKREWQLKNVQGFMMKRPVMCLQNRTAESGHKRNSTRGAIDVKALDVTSMHNCKTRACSPGESAGLGEMHCCLGI